LGADPYGTVFTLVVRRARYPVPYVHHIIVRFTHPEGWPPEGEREPPGTLDESPSLHYGRFGDYRHLGCYWNLHCRILQKYTGTFKEHKTQSEWHPCASQPSFEAGK